jgi:hypothetical protein
MIKLKELGLSEAMEAWPTAEQFLVEAHDDDTDKADAMRVLKSKVFSGLNTLWEITDDGRPVAYGVTIIYTPDGISKTAQVYLATSTEMDLLLDQVDQFESWAIQRGVNYLEVIGRKGWERKLKPHGFNHSYTSLVKRVNQEELH